MIETNWYETNNSYVLSKIITSIFPRKKKTYSTFFKIRKIKFRKFDETKISKSEEEIEEIKIIQIS